MKFFIQNRIMLFYAFGLSVILFLLKWLEIKLLIFHSAIELYTGMIAVIFTALGVWLTLNLLKPQVKTVVIEKEIYLTKNEDFVPNHSLIFKLGISNRELSVLQLLAQGYSNQEIASQLFVSLSTVKAHNQNLFEKLEVKRRTQAVEKAKRLNMIP